MSESVELSTTQADRAMFRFLEAYFERTDSNEIATLLGGLALTEDGWPMDPAAWDDWFAATDSAMGGPA